MLTHNEAESFYNAFGIKQDRQFYETKAINTLIEQGEFNTAKNIVEFGCGTGKLAARLLNTILPDDSHYTAVDISQTMVTLCKENIKPFSKRAQCYKNGGKPCLNIQEESADRFLCIYVLDLLTEKDITQLLNEAHRILLPGGYLCLASLTHGISFTSRIVEYCWRALFKLKPSIVGGCRPINLSGYLRNNKWQIIHDSTVISYAVPSEVVIAKKL